MKQKTNLKTVGIIGDLGPETTAEFYLQLIFETLKLNKVERPPILIWNVPIKLAIEQDLILHATGEERYIPYLIKAAKQLEAGGANFIVIPCNSVHLFIRQIRAAVSIPVLSIIEETTAFLVDKKIANVALFATSSTIKNQLYQPQLAAHNITIWKPNSAHQKEIDQLINKLVNSRQDEAAKNSLVKIISNARKHKVKAILLACTDLQLLIIPDNNLKVFDAMKILVDATVQHMTSTNS